MYLYIINVFSYRKSSVLKIIELNKLAKLTKIKK